jgi:hypothetical protein
MSCMSLCQVALSDSLRDGIHFILNPQKSTESLCLRIGIPRPGGSILSSFLARVRCSLYELLHLFYLQALVIMTSACEYVCPQPF